MKIPTKQISAFIVTVLLINATASPLIAFAEAEAVVDSIAISVANVATPAPEIVSETVPASPVISPIINSDAPAATETIQYSGSGGGHEEDDSCRESESTEDEYGEECDGDRVKNHKPKIANISDKIIPELSLYSFNVIASDRDGDTLTYSLESGAPEGAAIDSATGLFTWTPTEAQGPGNYTLTVIVKDSKNASASRNFKIEVTEVEDNINHAPVIATILDKTIPELIPFTFTVSANDQDGDTMMFFLDSSAPEGASIDSTGVFSWTPTDAQGPGEYPITVRVMDSKGAHTSTTFKITVVDSNVCHEQYPVTVLPWSGASTATVAAGSNFNYTLNWNGGPLNNSWRIFVHYVRADGYEFNLGNDFYPATSTNQWTGNIATPNSLTFPADTATGTYKVVVGLYEGSNRYTCLLAGDGVTKDNQYRFQVGTLIITEGKKGNIPPVVELNGPYDGEAGVQLVLKADISDSDGKIVGGTIEYGDGKKDDMSVAMDAPNLHFFINHTYTVGGIYTALYSAVDNDGATSTDTAILRIMGPENTLELCTDGKDNNLNELIDGSDPSCAALHVPGITFSANPTTIGTGATSTLSWTTINSSSCIASNGWTGDKATTTGSEIVGPYSETGTHTFVLTCTGNELTASSTVVITVSNGGGGDNPGTPPGGPNNTSGGSGSSSGSSGSYARTFALNIPSATTTCPLITTYMRLGGNNDSGDVVRLQSFYKNSEKYDVDVTGVFDEKTDKATRDFQIKYTNDILRQWETTIPSGYVFITTSKKINEFACARSLTLSASDLAVIEAYKQKIIAEASGLNTSGTSATSTSTGTTTPSIQNASSTPEIGKNTNTENSNVAAVGSTSFGSRIWKFFKNLFTW